MKKALSFVLALAMCLSLTVPVLAARPWDKNFGDAEVPEVLVVPLKAGDTEVTDSEGYTYRFSNPVAGGISNFKAFSDGESYVVEETYYQVPLGTVVTLQAPDGMPGMFTSVQVGDGSWAVNDSKFTVNSQGICRLNRAQGVDFIGLYLIGVESAPAEPQQPAAPLAAAPTNDKLTVNGAEQSPTVYKIKDNNYFKIRDLAAVLNGTEKQFDVGYDGTLKSVAAATGKGYAKLDTDLAGAAAGGIQQAFPSNDTIYIDGRKIDAAVFKINGSNYFKLRDLGKALDFYVGWTKEDGVFIDTGKPYSE